MSGEAIMTGVTGECPVADCSHKAFHMASTREQAVEVVTESIVRHIEVTHPLDAAKS